MDYVWAAACELRAPLKRRGCEPELHAWPAHVSVFRLRSVGAEDHWAPLRESLRLVRLEHLVTDARAAQLTEMVKPESAIVIQCHPRVQAADQAGKGGQIAESHIRIILLLAKLAPWRARAGAFISGLRNRLRVATDGQPVTKPNDCWPVRTRRADREAQLHLRPALVKNDRGNSLVRCHVHVN